MHEGNSIFANKRGSGEKKYDNEKNTENASSNSKPVKERTAAGVAQENIGATQKNLGKGSFEQEENTNLINNKKISGVRSQ